MEEDQEMIKHICKLCDKSFPCGRSLGGHMRSHVINSSTADQTDEKKLTRKKLSNLTNGLIESNEDNGYVLRENPKKTCRFADLNEDSLLHHKFCKQCGKGFCSWKALFGHMKCHSEKFSNSLEEDSWTSANQSDTETAAAAAPNRKKRSRRVTRYISTTTTTNSSFSVANNNNNNNNGSSSASEIDHQEQEEVALCLIMLSKDVGSKNNCMNSVDESSDNNFELLEAGSSIRSNRVTKNEGKNSWSNGGEAVKKLRKLRNGKLESTAYDSNSNGQFDLKQSEYGASQDSKLNKSEFHNHGFLGHDKSKKCKVEDGSRLKVSEVETGKDLVNENGGMDQAEFSSKKPNLNPKKLRNGKLSKSDFRDKGFLGNGKSKKSKVDDESRFEASEVEVSKNLGKENGLEDRAEFSSEKHKLNSKKPRTEKLLKSTILESNSQFDSFSGISRNESKPNKSGSRGDGVLGDYKSKKPKVDDESRFGPSELTPGEDLIKENGGQDQAEFSSRKHNVSKKKYRDLLNNQELGSESRSKFECTTCNKAFHSYQALGGHRASHKKTKGCCFSSKIDESENSIETENISLIKNEELIEQKGEKSCVVASKNNNKKGAHECPICFRVFSSGQALGGHKRSHLIAEAKSSNQTVVIQKPIPEIRDLLDLNLPAPVEEESSGNVGFKPWWVGTNSKPEPLLGFLSN